MSGFALHPEAYEDFDGIRSYIAENNPDAADRMVNEIFDAIRQLVRFPDQGFRRPKLTSLPLRFVAVRDYVIAYAPEKKPLWVMAVVHGRRNPRLIAAILHSRE
jgi:toxin ParE1/3/4